MITNNQLRERLIGSTEQYLEQVWRINDEEERERLVAGTLSFIAVNVWEKPYVPVYGVEEIEKPSFWQRIKEIFNV